ncbi:alanine racemase [Kitasatospora aureofaciens]|uniref:alanine racemase n=1 Tax=Kitasatospora aureofaciens TaxID=1894 RepID=UPI0036F452BB
MTLSLYLDTERWRTHQRSVLAEFPGLVPVAKGNGYGLGNHRLAEEATLLGTGVLAVGTAYEAADAAEWYGGELLVLTPYRVGEEVLPLPHARVIRTVASVDALRSLHGARVVLECMTTMRRHGVSAADLHTVAAELDGVAFEGLALHLPMDRPDGSSPVEEVMYWVDTAKAAGIPVHTVFVSHLGAAGMDQLSQRYPDTVFRARIGTRLWLGDHGALEVRATVLDVTPVRKGDRYGYRQHPAPADGHILVVAGGTAHGIGLEAPKYVASMGARAKGIARAGLATVNKTKSPFHWAGKQLWFAEPPHMQVSLLFLDGETAPPSIGEELGLQVRHTTTHFDRVVDR